jgi:hypothetical protein
MAAAPLFLWVAAATGLASPAEVRTLLDRIGDADLVLVNDPQSARPVRVLLATRAAASPRRLAEVLAAPASYAKAMPAFRQLEVVGRRPRGDGLADLQVAWELDVPLWNLSGKLWLRPRSDGADLVLEEGDLAPGLFHLTTRPDQPDRPDRSLFIVEGFANIAEANVAARQLSRRSPLAEPAMTVAAAYVVLKSLARLAQVGSPGRPTAAMARPEFAKLDGAATGAAALALPRARTLLAAVRSRPDGRLAGVEVAVRASPRARQRVSSSLAPERFHALPGWKKIKVVNAAPDTCQDPGASCWAVETNLPLFSLGGTWKIRTHPWRARMVAGDRKGALLGLDVVSAKGSRSSEAAIVLSEQPRPDRAGFLPRRLVAAEPYLEHGLALALAVVDAASLVPALARN